MPTESVWTALPNGRTATTLRLSAHVSPRLIVDGGADGVLADFPPFVDWPPEDLQIDVLFPGFAPFRATVVSAPDPTLWSRVLRPATTVNSFAPVDRSQLPVHSYPITKIAAFLKDQYARAAIDSPEFFPSIDDLLDGGFDDIRFSGRDGAIKWNNGMAEISGLLADNKVINTTSPSTTTFDFLQLREFFAPVDVADPANLATMTTDVEAPTVDFHAAVQYLNQHPPLLRLLGLVFDLEIDLGRVAPSGFTTVQLSPVAGALDGTVVRAPRTHCNVTPDAFDARPRPSTTHLAVGFLRLDDTTEYEVVAVEADGGGHKAVDFAGNLHRRSLHPTEDTPTESGLPTLRADGFSVARLGHANALHDKLVLLAQQETELAADTLELFADDLVRGVRVDAFDSLSNSWHSLMRRVGTYEIEGTTTVIPVEDEGTISTTATKKPVADDLHLAEEVFWWDGWSLVAPRPGKTLTIDPAAPDPLIDRPPNTPGPDFDVRFRFDVAPGTLPRLRYGADYRFRARTVDLAGNSRSHDDPDDTHATAAQPFGRFEPPQTPPVVLRTPRGPGESSETVALRSNFDVVPTPSTAQRHVVPPKVGQLMIEQHGLLEVVDPSDPSKVVLNSAAYSLLADRDAATLLNHPAGVIDPKEPDDTRHYDVDVLDVTWAPDPAARRMALRLLDGPHAGFLDSYPLAAASWPDHRSIRLVVVEGTGAPSFEPSTRVLTVPLDKADIVHARLSAIVDPDDLDAFGLWHWVLDELPPGPAGVQKRNELIGLVRSGQHWMFEPYRVLTLVHAVRQPLVRPEFPVVPLASRGPGDTFARISGHLSFSRKSTNRTDVLASWEEPVDDGPGTTAPANVGEPGAITVDRQTAIVIDTVHDEALHPTREDLRHRHEFGDTKHRKVTYRATATTRFPEFFTQRAELAFGGPSSAIALDTGNPAAGIVPGSVKVTHHPVGAPPSPLAEGTHYSVDHVTGTVAFGDGTQGALPPTGDPIVVVYLVPPVTRETADPPVAPGEFGPRLVSVPSSARPQAPKVLYALPTFGWHTGDHVEDGQVVGITSTRLGNGLRIYFERPWWTSGEGELLGAVLWPLAEQFNPPDLEDPEDPTDDADRRRPFVTQWGQDPVYGSQLLPHRYPRLASFPDAVATRTGLTLAELGSSTVLPVNVAGHAVGFDADRDLWFCDMTLDPGLAYAPFVRLALARYQPESIPNAHLSRVVLADFVQLAPDRSATVVFDDADDSVMAISLAGPTHSSTEASDGDHPGTARVIVEKRRTDFDGDLAWAQEGPAIELTPTFVAGQGLWTGEVHLPGPRTPGTWRLVVEQFELMGDEPTKKKQSANPFLPTTPVAVPRLVHTDIIPI